MHRTATPYNMELEGAPVGIDAKWCEWQHLIERRCARSAPTVRTGSVRQAGTQAAAGVYIDSSEHFDNHALVPIFHL